VIVRQIVDADRPWLHDLIDSEWGLPVVSISGAYDPSTLPGFLAEEEGNPIGAITYLLNAGECEVVTLNSVHERQGVGSALLAAAKAVAEGTSARLWLITTDENLNAIRFYEGRGMYVRTIHRDFVDRVQRFKAQVDEDRTEDGYRDAIEFSY
jgi:GNAT superfamily N-acetyltransferase